jgi:hypothetical protein
MGAAVGYFGNKYWASNYWAEAYWAPTAEPAGDFWAANFWAANYWATNYWSYGATGPGDIYVTSQASLSLNEFVARITTGASVQADTEVLTLTAFQSDANVDKVVTATLATLNVAAVNSGIGTSGYVLGDIDLTFSPESTITITYGNWPGVAPTTLTTYQPTTSTPDGLDVGVSIVDMAISAFVTDVQNIVAVEPLPVNLTLTAYDSPAAGIGELIKVTRETRIFSTPTHTISGIPEANIKVNRSVPLSLQEHETFIFTRVVTPIPDPTFPPDWSIENEFAVTWPSNYEIDDRTGFRVRRNGLREEWTGAMVREKSWERRHPQDFVRGVGDEQQGSPRPEQEDRFISDEYPSGVTADDL